MQQVLPQQEDIGLQHYFEVLWRRKWAIGVVFAIVFVLAVIGVFISKTTYTVHSKVAIRNSIYFRQSMLSFAQGTEAPTTTLSGTTYEEIINGLPFAQDVAKYLISEAITLDSMEIRGALRAEYQEPDLIRIHASHTDPNTAVILANAAADVFVETTKAYMRDELTKGKDSVEIMLEEARKECDDLEQQIADYRRQTGLVDVVSEMSTLSAKLAGFERARGDVITQLEVVQSTREELLVLAKVGASGQMYLSDPGIDEYRTLQTSVNEARIKYTENHPVLKNLTAELKSIEDRLRDTIARSGSNLTPEAFLTLKEELVTTEAEIARHQTAIKSWDRQIQEINDVLSAYPDRVATLTMMESKLDDARANAKTWTERLQDIDFKASKVPANAELVDRALIARPKLGKMTALILALLVSVMVGLGTGLIVEFADNAIRTPEEITLMGLGYLGSIVKLKDPTQPVFANGKPASQVAEDFTRIYSNIKFAEIESPFKSVLVTSARKNEGKSTTLVNLACAVAAAGKRVIIVDADMRNPTTQRMLGTHYNDGLTSVLAGEKTLEEALQPTDHPGLRLLPAGPLPPNPAELLHSQAMKDLIAEVETRADMVFFDAPPVLLVADAMLLAGEMDAAILVAESGGISRRLVQQVKESLDVAKARILGVILNKVQETGGSFYNYYYYYRGESQEEEEPSKSKVARLKDGLRKTMGGRS